MNEIRLSKGTKHMKLNFYTHSPINPIPSSCCVLNLFIRESCLVAIVTLTHVINEAPESF